MALEMEFEVAPILGRIRAADVRFVLGEAAMIAEHVDVLVLAADGGLPFMGRLELARTDAGRARHLALRCPRCVRPRKFLVADGRGGISCAGCANLRTRRQQGRTCRAWTRLGERELDALLRLMRPRSSAHAGRYDRAVEMVDALIAGDVDRLGAILDVTDAALMGARDVRLERDSDRAP